MKSPEAQISSAPDIVLMPKEMQDYWPSLIEPINDAWPDEQHEPQTGPETLGDGLQGAAISAEDLLKFMTDMKEFMNLVLKVAFNQMHLYKHSEYAKSRYQELLKDEIWDSGEFPEKIRNYFDEFIHETY